MYLNPKTKIKENSIMNFVKFNNGLGKQHNGPFFDGKLADDFFRPFFADRAAHCSAPAVNVTESAEAFHIEVAAPGLAKEDFKISLEKDVMSIKVTKELNSEEGQPTWHRREFNYSNFERSFKLPKVVNQEAIQAKYEAGILLVTLPKLEAIAEKTVKEISIS